MPQQLYTAVSGDTLESVSQRFYGEESHADYLAVINGIGPGEQLQPGQMLTIPTQP